jgi:hypothetical protein
MIEKALDFLVLASISMSLRLAVAILKLVRGPNSPAAAKESSEPPDRAELHG